MLQQLSNAQPCIQALFSMHTTWNNTTHTFYPRPKPHNHHTAIASLQRDIFTLMTHTRENITYLTPPPSTPNTHNERHNHPQTPQPFRPHFTSRTKTPYTPLHKSTQSHTHTTPTTATQTTASKRVVKIKTKKGLKKDGRRTINAASEEGRLITIFTWNTGPGGLFTNLQTLMETLRQKRPTVFHCQDTRTTKESVPTLRRLIETLCPDYKVYTNSKSSNRNNNTNGYHAVMTLIYHSVLPYTKQAKMSHSGVAGRLLIFEITMPAGKGTVTTSNMYMPTTGDTTEATRHMYCEIEDDLR